MGWMKRISIWIVLSLSLQCLGLFYIDHFFLATDSKVVVKKVVENASTKPKNIDISVPSNSTKRSVSYDAKYLSYYDENDNLVVANCRDGKTRKIKANDGCKISFAEWLPDRNRMLLVEKKTDNNSSNLVLYSYDVLKTEKVKIKELEWGGTNPVVEDIQTSTLTGVTYVKVSSSNEKTSIYRIDRMGEMTKINTIPSLVSNIALVRHQDKLVYEGLVYNKIYATGRAENISVSNANKLTLIGADDDDNIYLAELKDNLISKVYYGKATQDTSEWKSINLQKPCAKENLFVTPTGKMYQNDELEGSIKDIESGAQTSYNGKLVQLYTKGIVSLVNNKISFVLFK